MLVLGTEECRSPSVAGEVSIVLGGTAEKQASHRKEGKHRALPRAIAIAAPCEKPTSPITSSARHDVDDDDDDDDDDAKDTRVSRLSMSCDA